MSINSLSATMLTASLKTAKMVQNQAHHFTRLPQATAKPGQSFAITTPSQPTQQVPVCYASPKRISTATAGLVTDQPTVPICTGGPGTQSMRTKASFDILS